MNTVTGWPALQGATWECTRIRRWTPPPSRRGMTASLLARYLHSRP